MRPEIAMRNCLNLIELELSVHSFELIILPTHSHNSEFLNWQSNQYRLLKRLLNPSVLYPL